MKRRAKGKTFRIKTNVWGNTYAYFGAKRIKLFSDSFSQESPKEWADRVISKGHTVKFA